MKLFSGSAPAMPAPQKPAPMPDEAAIQAAKRRSVIDQMQRSGRSSTILSDKEGL